MSGPKYDFEIDLTNRNNGHTLMIELIGSNKRVLEVGCATGYMSRVLTERGCEVIGLELDEESAELARAHCERVIVGNIETFDPSSEFEAQTFDVVVFGDVLEHLRDPLSALQSVRPLLRQDGYVVSSIPNIAHGAVRLSLLKGEFDYRPLGLLDETHLHFFTRDGVERMYSDAGFCLVQMERTQVGLFDTEIKIDAQDFDQSVIETVLKDPESITYQFVGKAILDNAASGVRELHAREEAQRSRIYELESQMNRLEAELAHLKETSLEASEAEGFKSRIDQLQSELEAERDRRVRAEAEEQAHKERWARLEDRMPVKLFRKLQDLGLVTHDDGEAN